MRPTLAIALVAATLLGACRDRPQPVTGYNPPPPRRVVVVHHHQAKPPIPGATVTAPVPAAVLVPVPVVVSPVGGKPPAS